MTKRTSRKAAAKPMLPRERGDFSAIVDRPPLKLPGGARSCSGPSSISKCWDIGKPMARQVLAPPTGADAAPRCAELELARIRHAGRRVALLRSVQAPENPADAGDQCAGLRGLCARRRTGANATRWEFMGHSYEQGPIHKEPNQKAMIARSLDVIERFCGKRPVGWLGPGLTQTLETPDLLAAGRHQIYRRLGL